MFIDWERAKTWSMDTLLNLVYQGIVDGKAAAAQRTDLPPKDRERLANIEPCQHTEQAVIVIVKKCNVCGKVINDRVTAGDKCTPLIQQIRQGLLPPDMAVQDSRLSDADRQLLENILVCEHPKDKRETRMCSGIEKEVCGDCGRRFGFPDQWVLDH